MDGLLIPCILCHTGQHLELGKRTKEVEARKGRDVKMKVVQKGYFREGERKNKMLLIYLPIAFAESQLVISARSMGAQTNKQTS